ncbi:MAG: RecX family transcriptional regulator [Pelolinea sp.]|nr:RecX family transcriptional regulator [Pelolinea sp.]
MEKTITALEAQKRYADRINVFLDGEFAFGVSRFVGAWLSVGQKIDEIKSRSLISADEKERALQYALRFIGYKQRTEAEVIKKLEHLEFPSEIINNIMSELKEKRYVDDKEFASQWIESRGESKPRSKRYFQFELRKKGIPGEIIDVALENAPDDLVSAIRLGKTYLIRYSAINDDEFRKKMTGVFSRRAFPYSIVKDALDELLRIRKEEHEV